VQDAPLLPEPGGGGGGWVGERVTAGGGGGGGGGGRVCTMRGQVSLCSTAAALVRPRTAPVSTHHTSHFTLHTSHFTRDTSCSNSVGRRLLTATRFLSSTAVHTSTNSRPRYCCDDDDDDDDDDDTDDNNNNDNDASD
jgi:hypothetical protein